MRGEGFDYVNEVEQQLDRACIERDKAEAKLSRLRKHAAGVIAGEDVASEALDLADAVMREFYA